ncbi:hypothetical protein BOX15_Mlig024360g3, partial [Macrostomum lignano]
SNLAMSTSKSKAAKQADERWSWTESVEPGDIAEHQLMKAYNLLSDTCPLGACRGNCRQNPCCLNGLGPDKFAETAEAATSLAAMAGPVALAAAAAKQPPSCCPGDAEADADDATGQQDDSAAVSSSDGPIGLTNYGNTCYLNSLLQLYLRSPDLVQAVYRLPSDDDAIIRELQSIFARLHLQRDGVCEPVAFIEALNLDKGIQQDASEFRILFRQLLERRFDEFDDNVMKHYTGSYKYVTRCHACTYLSERESNFHELCLNLTSTLLTDCLREFLARQDLAGESQYNCPVCQAPRDASVGVELVSLPDELCLQLMRFDFDMRTLRKKKVKSPIAYPETIEMSEFLSGAEPYVLKAVLIHIGPQATGGHYVAIVRDYSRGWLVCNDSQVYPVKHKLLKRQEEKLEQSMGYSASRPTEKASAAVPGKDWHLSQNAYILVYEKRSVFEAHKANPNLAAVPDKLAELVNAENVARARLASAVARRERRHRDFLGRLASRVLPLLQRVDCHAFVPSAWLQTVFNSSPEDVGESGDEVAFFLRTLDSCAYAQYVCPHGRLLPECVGPHVKAVNRDLFDFLSNNQSSSASAAEPDGKAAEDDDAMSTDSVVTPVPAPFLAGESALCLACVRQRCARIRLDSRLATDAKLIDKAAKRKPEYQHHLPQNGQASSSSNSGASSRSAWVGVKSLRSWKNLARQQHQEESAPASAVEDDQDNTDGSAATEQSGSVCSNQQAVSNGHPATVGFAFNEDLLCQHGNLCCETGRRRLLPEEIWHRLAAYFPNCPVYWHDAKPCPVCSDQRARLTSRAQAETDRLFHLSAHLKRHRPTGSGPQRLLSLADCAGRKIYYADAEFLVQWRRFVVAAAVAAAEEESTATPLTEPPGGPVPNSGHLCPHGRLLCRPDSADSGLVALTQDEWLALVDAYSSDGVEICRLEDDSCQPPVCDECLDSAADAASAGDAGDAAGGEVGDAGAGFKMTIYVRVAEDARGSVRPGGYAASTRSSAGRKRAATSAASTDQSATADAAADEGGVGNGIKSPPTKCAKSAQQQPQPWRSSRIRRKPTDKRFDIDSEATVQDLKLRLMEAYGVAPYDQHLLVDGRELEPAKAQLRHLGLGPGSVVDAAFDLPPGSEDAAAVTGAGLSLRRGGGNDSTLTEAASATGPNEIEIGFSGTRLFEAAPPAAAAPVAVAAEAQETLES